MKCENPDCGNEVEKSGLCRECLSALVKVKRPDLFY